MFEARRRRRRLAEATANSRPTEFWVLLVRAGNSEAVADESFDRGPCWRCVTAAVPSGPLFLPGSAARAVKNAQPAVLLGSHQVLMHASLLERLDAAGLLEGLSRRPVRVAGDDEATQYEHVTAITVLPPLDPLTVGVELDESLPPCPECGRDGRYDDPEGGVYVLPPSAALGAPWQSTWEHFGRSRTWDEAVGNVAAARFVVSGAVRDVMRAETTRADFIEVRQLA